jgi:recombination associated protein RdgC
MGILAGAFAGQVFRAGRGGEADLDDVRKSEFQLERRLERHSFRAIDPERGELVSMGWVNIRQLLDSRLNVEKVLFGDWIVLAVRIDAIRINQRVFWAKLAQAVAKKLRDAGRDTLSREERLVIEDEVRLGMIKRTEPRTVVIDVAWRIGDGLVLFGSSSAKAGMLFGMLFEECFEVRVSGGSAFQRAQRWADAHGLGQELLELLPAPMSPDAPGEAMAAVEDEDEEEM